MLRHLAIIMDGNGRWAKQRHLPRTAGHKRGAETTRQIIEASAKSGVGYLTLYTFSAENWNRPQDEVNDLMNLLRYYIGKEVKTLHENNIKIVIIGDRDRLAPDIRSGIEEAERLTTKNTKLQVNLALSYGSRQELTQATRSIAHQVAIGAINASDISTDTMEQHLYTAAIPAPDFLIRTGGERRLSNFLLWQSAYTELHFTDTLWPDFNEKELSNALENFTSRQRRFGRTADQTDTTEIEHNETSGANHE